MFKRNRFGAVGKRRKSALASVLLPVLILVAIIAAFYMGINYLTQANEDESLDAIRTAITRATVQFYALEGRYPPSLDYLIEQFGLQLDQERYLIHFNVFASNIMPQITVLRREI
jgi:hypothetical protein